MIGDHKQAIVGALGEHMQTLHEHMNHALRVQEAIHQDAVAKIGEAVKALSAPKRVIRDASGRISGVEPALQPSTGDTQ